MPLSRVTSSLPLVVRGPCGFGRVTLIALDVDNKLFSDWPDRGLFWARAIDLRSQRPDAGTAVFDHTEWSVFIAGVKDGDYDL